MSANSGHGQQAKDYYEMRLVSSPYHGTEPTPLPKFRLPEGSLGFVYIDSEIVPGVRQWLVEPITPENIDTIKVMFNGKIVFNNPQYGRKITN